MDIKDTRKRVGLTQVQLSEVTGIDQASISRMENGKQGISLEQLKRIASALGVELGELVGDAPRH
jgi:transcriptional regulator with XRE-family HTH domain